MKKQLLLGAHMSCAGGLHKALLAGKSIGCTAVQLFTHSNRQWHLNPLKEEEIELFKKTCKETEISSLMVHASYLLNIASPDKDLYIKSLRVLAEELKRCEQLFIPYLVIHPGSYSTDLLELSLNRISHTINRIFEGVPGKTKILLENTAGQGRSVGYAFEHLATIINEIENKNRIGICFDTCHAFAAGYDFSTADKYAAMWKYFDQIIGLKYLKAMHLNDSKKDLKSRVDRHEEIGKGKLGLETFALIMNDPQLFDIPKVLETPYHTLADYEANLTVLQKLLTPSTQITLGYTSKKSDS
jgi:deoxyribonuclease-4